MTTHSLGLLFALSCAISNVGMDVTQKKALADRPLLTSIVALRFTVLAFMTLVILVRHLFGFPLPWQAITLDMLRSTPHFLLFAIVDCALVALSALLYYGALQIAPLSVTIPFLAFTPVFLLFSQWLVLGESISLSEVEAVAIVVFGSVLMYRTRFRLGWLEPVRALVRERGSRYMLLVALILAFTNVLEKWLVVRSGNFTFAWIYAAVSFVLFTLVLLVISVRRRASFKGLRWPMILLGGSLDGTTLLLQYEAFLYLSPVTTISFKRGGILLTVLAGWFFFKERHIAERLIAASIMICGALMLYLKFNTLQQSVLVIAAVIAGVAGPRLLRRRRQVILPPATVRED